MATLEDSLVAWVNSFSVNHGSCTKLSDLADGVVMFEIMTEIAPDFFDINNINLTPEDNWALKNGNLKKLKNCLQSFYVESLGQHPDLDSVDLSAIGRTGNEEHIQALLKFIVGAAVLCENREVYIGNIMNQLDEHAQGHLMVLIESIMSQVGDDGRKSVGRVSFARGGLDVFQEKAELEHQIDSLSKDNESLKQKTEDLAAERDALQKRVEEMETAEREAKKVEETSLAESRRKTQQVSIDTTALTAEFENDIKEKDALIAELRRKNDELTRKLTEETNAMRDELDIARTKLQQASKTEATLAKYKKKLEEVGDVRKRMAELEEQNEKALQRNIEMENDLKQVLNLRQQVNSYKDAVADKEASLQELQVTLQLKEAEINSMQESLEQAENAKSFQEQQVDQLTRELSRLRHELHLSDDSADLSALNSALSASANGGSSSGSLLSNELHASPDIKERLMRLERENETLRATAGPEISAKIADLENQLDDANRIKSRMEQNYKTAHHRATELEKQLIQLEGRLKTATTDKSSSSEEQQSLVAALREENLKLTDSLTAAQNHVQKLLKMEDEVERLRDANTKQLAETTRMYKEKDEVNTKLMEAREEFLRQQALVNEKEAFIKSKDAEISRLQVEIAQLHSSEKLLSQELALSRNKADTAGAGTHELQLLKLERERDELKYKSIIENLENKVAEKERQLSTMISDRDQMSKSLKQAQENVSQSIELKYKEAIKTLQTQLDEKDKEVQFLKRMRDESKDASKREERLIVSAFYEIGLELQRVKMQQGRPPQAASWLHRERSKIQASSTK
eukprot:GILK01003995.1.p1 GENE.GILK01003995.1~~GILK01003995.1.p1  ORF type:complete len:836 (+),score=230.20 GILK01003995.1:93-2510(+)